MVMPFIMINGVYLLFFMYLPYNGQVAIICLINIGRFAKWQSKEALVNVAQSNHMAS